MDKLNKFEIDEIKNMTKMALWNKNKKQSKLNTTELEKDPIKSIDIRISMPWTMQNI